MLALLVGLFSTSRYATVLRTVATFVVACILMVVLQHAWPRPPQVVYETPTTKTVFVDKLVTKDIEKVVTDPQQAKQVAALLAENKKLKAQVQALVIANATHEVHGEGPIVRLDPYVPGPLPTATPAPAAVGSYHFEDFRLNFTTDLTRAKYDLHQRFEVLSTLAKTKAGVPFTTVKLNEVGPQGERWPLDVTSTLIEAAPKDASWFVGPKVQAGLAKTTVDTGAVVGLQWLRRGSTKATEDTTFALLTPVAFLSTDVKEAGVLPVSVNLGRIKHQPFTNLWVSPYVGISVAHRTASSAGVALTATF
jgi:hypothetical protein